VATKSFAINTEPHTANVGGTVLSFRAEVIGADFAQAYVALHTVQMKIKGTKGGKGPKHAEEELPDPSVLAEVHEAMRGFIRRFLLEDSHAAFDALPLPDRVLVQLIEWTADLYGGGSGNGRGGPSSGS
jgi:hypothetical protein